MKKSKSRLKVPRVRNRLATSPLLMKGGAHVKTRKAQRKADKQTLVKELPVE